MYELYKGATIMVDYKAQYHQDIIDYFEELSMFEGWATLQDIDEEEGLFYMAEMPLTPISVEYLIVMNEDTNEFEYYNKGKKDGI